MAAEFLWTLPVRGDGRRARRDEWNRGDWHPGIASSPKFVTDDRREVTDPFAHLEAVTAAAEHGSFDGLVVPYDLAGEESWIVATVAARATRWIRPVVEFAPSITTPVYAAKLTATTQRISKGRLDWKLAVEFDEATALAQGDHVTGAERYDRADEFLTIARAVWLETGFDYEGRYYAVDSGGFGEPLNVHAFPRVFLSGGSPEALTLGAKQGDIHLLTADAALDEAVADLARRSAAIGRAPRVGLTLRVIAREETGEAVDRVIRLLAERGTGTKADIDALSIGEGIWSGFDRLGFDTPIGLLGSYVEVEAAIRSYVERGVEVFVLEGYPHTEEAYRVGQHLLPLFNAPALAGERN